MLQRAKGRLESDELLELAEQAARPGERRTGSYGLSVSEVRERLLARQGTETSATLIVETERGRVVPVGKSERLRTARSRQEGAVTFSHSPKLRPEVRWIVEALVSNTLTDEEKSVLSDAIEQSKTGEAKG